MTFSPVHSCHRLAKQHNGTSDLPAMIVRQVLTAVEPDLNEEEELGIEGL